MVAMVGPMMMHSLRARITGIMIIYLEFVCPGPPRECPSPLSRLLCVVCATGAADLPSPSLSPALLHPCTRAVVCATGAAPSLACVPLVHLPVLPDPYE